MAEQDNGPEIQNLDQALDNLQLYLNGKDKTAPTLRSNWVWLQIYATQGLRLPNTAADLRTVLNLSETDAANYHWFDSMYEAYDEINKASSFFFDEVFDQMTALGEGLKSYVHENAGKGEDSTFNFICSLVKPTDGTAPDPVTALDVLSDLKSTADANQKKAEAITTNLSDFKTKLTKASSSCSEVKTSIDADDRTSQATIDKLSGGKDIMGSLKQLNDMLDSDKSEYKHDVVVASTSVTYCWVVWPVPPFPIGLVAAASVAGVFGKRAVDMKDTIDKLEGEISTANHELKVAQATQQTVTLAQSSVDSVLKHTNLAIAKVTQIKNSWAKWSGSLENIHQKISYVLTTKDDKEKLKSLRSVDFYMKKANKLWITLQPTIDAMVTNPYITVDPDAKNIKKFAEEVVAEANKLENAA